MEVGRRKKLVAAVNRNREEARSRTKEIEFELPDLRGPSGNAFILLAQARSLMKANDISEGVMSEFSQEAKSGDYRKLLKTIDDWFTVVLPVTQYVPLDRPIEDLFPDMLREDEPDVDMEAAALAAKERYAHYEDSPDPVVIDLTGETGMDRVLEKLSKITGQNIEGVVVTP